MSRNAVIVSMLCIVVAVSSCRNRSQVRGPIDTPTSGIISISVDESFAPLIQREVDVFEGTHPGAGILIKDTSEVEAINLFVQDSLRLAVATRKLTEAETQTLKDKKLNPRTIKIATDGIALITNKQNSDSMLSLPDLTKILTGRITQWRELDPKSNLGDILMVFDHTNSSTVRYAIDSLCHGAPLYEKGLRAQHTNEQVIDYVARTPNALGVIGVAWIGNEEDSTNLSFSDRVNVMRLSRENPATVVNSFKPFQAYLALGNYPLTRDVYIHLTDPRVGLASGFTTFVCSYPGQLLILKTGIVPATQSVQIRQVNVRDNL